MAGNEWPPLLVPDPPGQEGKSPDILPKIPSTDEGKRSKGCEENSKVLVVESLTSAYRQLEDKKLQPVPSWSKSLCYEGKKMTVFQDSQKLDDVLRLRGGAGEEDSSSGDEERKMLPPPRKRQRGLPNQLTVGLLEKTRQRPAPMDPPREQNLEYGNMTADVVENEDGTEIFSSCLDSYRRTDAQVEAVRDAGKDQRKMGGGVYQKKDGSQTFLTIQKGYMSKDIGLKLVTEEEGNMRTKFSCFATMNYEYFKFCKSTPGLRIRQEPPQETRTGYIWHGYGADLSPSEAKCGVYIFCERAGERDMHVSVVGCDRLAEAPGASQEMCSNRTCGQVKWHLSQKEFFYDNNEQWQEVQQNDFALIVFDSGREELVWTEQPEVGEPVRSHWVRLEESDQFDGVHVDTGSKQRLKNFLNKQRLPAYHFPVPTYVCRVLRWRDQEVLKRQEPNCDR